MTTKTVNGTNNEINNETSNEIARTATTTSFDHSATGTGIQSTLSMVQVIKYPKNSGEPRKITTLEGQEIRQVAAGGKHTLFITKEGNLYSCGTAGSNARLGHLNDEEQSVPKLVEYFIRRTISEDDRWAVSFVSIFSMSNPPETIHDRRRALPKEAAVVNGKLLNGNRVSPACVADIQQPLAEVRYANVRRQCMNLFRKYDTKTRGYLSPLGIERIFPRVGIFLFDFQVDRVCKDYHKPGDPGGSNEITESRLLEYLDDSRKDKQSGILHTIWKTAIASSPSAFVSEDFIEDFCEMFEKKCNEYGEPAPHEAVHLLSKPIPPVGRKKPLKKDKRRYKKIMKGFLNLQHCGLTDVHMKALMFAQKAIPIFHSLDLRKNLLSDLSLEPLKECLDWHLDCDDLGAENLYCWNCMSVAEFNKRTTNTTFCMACGTTLHRPRYMLQNVKLNEKKTTPKMELKWWELEFDEDCLATMSDHLESHKKTTPDEFEEMVWEIAQKYIEDFSATISTPLVAVTKKDKKAIANKEELLDHFDKWVKRRFAERYWDMYHRQACYELYEMAKQIAMKMTRQVNDVVHQTIPTSTQHILSVTQDYHQQAKDELNQAKWYVAPIMPLVYDVIFIASRNIFRHYASANLDCRPDSVSCGERYSTIAMESGRVVTIGNQDDLIESFKEEILGNLPSRFRKMFALLRVKKAKKYAAEQARAAKMMKDVDAAEEAILRARQEETQQQQQQRAEPLEEEEEASYLSRSQGSVHSQRTKQSNQSDSDDEENSYISRSHGSVQSQHTPKSNQQDSEDDENEEYRDENNENNENNENSVNNENSANNNSIPLYYNNHNSAVKKRMELVNITDITARHQDNKQNHIVFDPMNDNDLRNDKNDKEDDEDDQDGPASPIRYSPVRQSPVRRMTGLGLVSSSQPSKKTLTNLTLQLMTHQIPPFVELEPDEYHQDELQSSEPVLHARDVLDDPDDFNTLFEDMLTVYKNGHHAWIEDDADAILQETEAVYTFAHEEWGDETFMAEHAHQMEEAREKNRLQSHIKRHADEILVGNNNSNENGDEDKNEDTDDVDKDDEEYEEDSMDEFRSEFGDSMDGSIVTELGGLEEYDGERIMEKDAVYIFSGGRTTRKKLRIGSSDQDPADGVLIQGQHRSFFSDSRPRIRTHDIFGRRYK
jgi:hypothetical protein